MKIISTLTRIYVNDIEPALKFYEAVFGLKVTSRYESAGLEMAEVGNFLFIAGREEALRFVKRVSVTVVVDAVDEFRPQLEAAGAQILRMPQPGPAGKSMIVRHPDNLTVEYIERLVK